MGSNQEEAAAILESLRRIRSALDRANRRILERTGLSSVQLACLRRIVFAGSATPSRLAAEVGASPAALTGVVDRLTDRGLVLRHRDPADRRRIRLTATPEGTALAARAASLSPVGERIFSLPREQRAAVEEALRRVAEMLCGPETGRS